MLSSHDPAGETTPTCFRHRTSSSSTTTTTSASSPSPPRTMEEVWNDITLDFVPGTPSVHHRPNAAPSSAVSPSFRSLILQDFLNCPTSATALPNAAADDAGGPLQCLSPGNKRLLVDSADGAPADRRHKRMIKNRESAARSRARKQAYINELELEVTQLKEENSRLREQQQKQILQVSPAVQVNNKRALHRTLTAPF